MTDAQHIRPLTSLRFFAAFWVVLFHYWPKLEGVSASPALVEKGYLGVELFFILSGFILCHVYREAVDEGRFRYRSFLWARLARVYPLHLATLIGMGVLAAVATIAGFGVDPNIASLGALPANLLMVHAWGFAPVAGWNHPSWSISAEWFAYLTFPLFAWGVLKLKNQPMLAVGLAAAFLTALYIGFEAVAGFPLTQATIHWGALRIVPCFALGCALHAYWSERPMASTAQALFGACFFGAFALGAASEGAQDALIVVALGFVILFLAGLAQTGSNLLGQAPLVYLGEISYSIYMVCVPWKIVFVNLATKTLQLKNEQLPLSVWLVFLVGVIPLAAASYHLIEKPARAWMKSAADRKGARRLSAARA